MATAKDLDFTYSVIDKLFRESIGEMGDFSGARYDGDFSLSLEEAQRRKHEFVVSSLGLEAGHRALDLGCGWGPMLNYFRKQGIHGVGVTLSRAQARAGRKNGLDVHLMDCRAVRPDTFGTFDGVVSLGAFEHFCSLEDYKAGRQESLYKSFFEGVAQLLPKGGRFYLQTMVFGSRMIPAEEISIDADRDSDSFMLARMQKMFPGSWLPYGLEQLTRTSSPWFKVVSSSSGRTDYIETIRQWARRFSQRTPKKMLLYATLAPRYFLDRNFRHAIGHPGSANSECFKRDLLDHYRIVLEKAA